MTWLSTRRNASVGKSPLSGMPPANEITAGFDVAALTSVRARSSSAAMICALRERSAGQSRGAGASGAGAARSPSTEGGPPEVRRGSEAPGAPGLSVTNVPWPTWARAQPAATSSSYASATVPRFTPSECASSRVAGSFIPGASSRSRMSRSRCAWIWRARGIGLSRSSAIFTVVTLPSHFDLESNPVKSQLDWPPPGQSRRPL